MAEQKVGITMVQLLKLIRNYISHFSLPLLSLLIASTAFADTAPVAHWVSDPVAPGETAIVIGEHLDDITSITLRRLADNIEKKGGEGEAVKVKLLQESPTSVKFILPDNFTAGVFQATLATKTGGVTRILNAPVVYWIQGDHGRAATSGGWVRVLGRDIARTPQAVLRFSHGGALVASVVVAAADLWDGRFDIPASLAAGHYELTLWNGNGSEEAVAALGDFDVLPAPTPATGPEVTLVADISGHADDTRRINEALLAMGDTGGGTVHLSGGTFTVSAQLDIPPHVALQGAGMDVTTIVLADQPTPPDAVISGREAFTVSNLAISARMHAHIIRGGFDGDKPIPDASDIVIDHVLIRASLYSGHLTPEDVKQRMIFALGFSSGGPDAIRLSGSRIRVVGCDILSSGRSLFLSSVRDGIIAGNRLFNGRYGWYSISVSHDVIIENNDIVGADLQSTGGGINTLFGSGDFASSNILIKKNRFVRFFGWDREAMTSDGGGGCYAGPIAFEAGARLVRATNANLQTSLDRCRGGALMVLDGAGRGTIREIDRGDGASATLTEPMVASSDASSYAVVGPMQRNYLIIGNAFEDTGALQFFGASINHVVADNTFVRSDGIFLRALRYKELQPILYVQILNNHILSAPPGRNGLIQIRTDPPADLTAPLLIGVVVRNNELMSNSRIEVRSGNNARSGATDILIENNRVSHVHDGISLDRSTHQALVTGNVFDDVARPVADSSQR